MSQPFLIFFLDFTLFFNAITLLYAQKLPTLLKMLVVDVKSGRFMYQRGRARDEAKKGKSPTKSGRVGISGLTTQLYLWVRLDFMVSKIKWKQKTPRAT